MGSSSAFIWAHQIRVSDWSDFFALYQAGQKKIGKHRLTPVFRDFLGIYEKYKKYCIKMFCAIDARKWRETAKKSEVADIGHVSAWELISE